MRHCLSHTQSKLIILDAERADRVEPVVYQLLADTGATGCLVLGANEGKGLWQGMRLWKHVMDNFKGNIQGVLKSNLDILPEDNATIFFTSGMSAALPQLLTLKSILRHDWPTKGGLEHSKDVFDQCSKCAAPNAIHSLIKLI
jgi:hypothetical protein